MCQCKISYLISIHVIYTQSHGRVLTRRIRQRRPTAMPSRGRLSVHDEQYYSFRTRILHPGKAQRELPAVIKHYTYIGDTTRTGVDTHTPVIAIRYSSTTSSYAHYTTLRVEYTLVRYDFIARTIRCATAVRLLPHHVYGWSSVQRLVDLKLPYDRLYPLLLCVARSWVAHLFYLRNTVLFIEISPPV